MAEPNERARFNRVRQELLPFMESMRKAAEYLAKPLVMDEGAMTFKYTGDDRIKLNRIG